MIGKPNNLLDYHDLQSIKDTAEFIVGVLVILSIFIVPIVVISVVSFL